MDITLASDIELQIRRCTLEFGRPNVLFITHRDYCRLTTPPLRVHFVELGAPHVGFESSDVTLQPGYQIASDQ